MKKFYYASLFAFLLFLVPHTVIGQCEDVTIESLTNPGPYDIDTLTEADGIRNGPDYAGATIYYPTNATPPFASIAIVPGFSAAPSSVAQWGPFYASHGIVTIIIGTNSPFDFPEARAAALIDALETMRQENSRTASPLEGDLDTDKFGVSGWSMGGGGAQRAAVLDPTIKGVIALCPWLTNVQLNHNSPTLIFSGENDPTAPPAQHANIHYNATPLTTDKLLFEVDNGNHSVANTPNGGDGAVGRIALSWAKLYLEDDSCYCPLFGESLLNNPPAASLVLSNFPCSVLSVEDNIVDIGLYPNPTQGEIYLESQEDVLYKVYSAVGQLLLEGTLINGNSKIDLSQLATGTYFVVANQETLKVIKSN